jgi:hypothetical protein
VNDIFLKTAHVYNLHNEEKTKKITISRKISKEKIL